MRAWEDYERQRRQLEIKDLRWHWGSAYEITRRNGILRATRRDDGASVTALTAECLRAEIRADYRVRPVPRDLGATVMDIGRPRRCNRRPDMP